MHSDILIAFSHLLERYLISYNDRKISIHQANIATNKQRRDVIYDKTGSSTFEKDIEKLTNLITDV
jgi:hypothetical protein